MIHTAPFDHRIDVFGGIHEKEATQPAHVTPFSSFIYARANEKNDSLNALYIMRLYGLNSLLRFILLIETTPF
jgi:hypothetical protein